MAETVVELTGEIDVAVVPRIKAQLQSAVAESPGGTVVADLAAVTFIDSTGLGVLVSGLKAARSSGGELVLRNTPAHIAKVFSITGLDKAFTLT